jgi:hypothetical protein
LAFENLLLANLKVFYATVSFFGYLFLFIHLENTLMDLVEKENEHHNMKEVIWWSPH